MTRFFYSLIISFFIFSCSNEKPSGEPTAEPAQPAPVAEALAPSIPLEYIQNLWDKCTQVDYIYHNYPFTISLSEKAAIQGSIRHIAESPVPNNLNCQPAGIVTYQIDGNIVLRGDFYFSTDCTYFVFYDMENNGKYSNYMTQEGVTYYNNQIQQGLNLRNQTQQ